MLTQDFKKDFLFLINKIFVEKQNVAFVRFNEGEYKLLVGEMFVGANSLWRTYKNSLLAYDLNNSLNIISDDYIYGIASQQHKEANEWYKNNIPGNKTFATIFVNNNYKYFFEVLKNIDEKVLIVANEKTSILPFDFKLYSIPCDVVRYYEENKNEVLEICKKIATHKNKLVLFCAGPLSNIMIYECYKLNKNNRYVDIGSTLDLYIHGEPTRQYYCGATKNQIDIY